MSLLSLKYLIENLSSSFYFPYCYLQVTHDVKERLENLQNEMESKELTPEEQEARIKAEKMKIALEKMKAASFQKVCSF